MLRIAVTGPESTGKSWLAEQLAIHYKTRWVPEFAREFLEKSPLYTYDDILQIAKGQLSSEQSLVKKSDKLIFADTELIVTRIWCEVKYQKVHPWILENIKAQQYDLYLLCNIDLKWEYDPLREHPDRREELLQRYISVLEETGADYRIVSGKGEERLQHALSFIEELLHSKGNS
jgi:NadR type nicotinamide-nucleotide adenylyltransferase